MNQRKAGIVLSYVVQLVQILTALIYTPVMLRILGQSQYGLYQLTYSVVSYLSLLGLGFSSAYIRFYVREKTRNEERVAQLNGMFAVIFLIIAAVCLLCGLLMVRNIEVFFKAGLTLNEYKEARVLMGVMVFDMALSFPNSLFNSIVLSQERFVFQKTLILMQAILTPFLSLPILFLGYGTIGMVIVVTFLTIVVLIINIVYCLKVLHIRFSYKKFDLSLLREMWGFTFFIFLNQIIDQINWNVDKFLLGRFSGTISVAIYSVGAQINTMYIQLSTAVSSVFIPKINEIVANSEDDSKVSDIFIKIGRIQCMIMVLVLTGFICFGRQFVTFWAGEDYGISYYVAIVLIVPITVPLIQNIGIEIQRAKNKHKARSIVYFAISIANIIMSIPLISYFGIIGAAVGTAVSLLIGNGIFMNWYYYKKLNINIPAFWKSLRDFLPTIVVAIICCIINNLYVSYSSALFLFIGIFVFAIVYCVSIYFSGMNQEEKSIIQTPITSIIRKNK